MKFRPTEDGNLFLEVNPEQAEMLTHIFIRAASHMDDYDLVELALDLADELEEYTDGLTE